MEKENLIPLSELCNHYKIEMSFFHSIHDYGLIEITTIEQGLCIHKEKISDLEKIIRLHNELAINLEGIDTIFNLLSKIDDLNLELNSVKNKLRLYEK